MRAFYLLNIQIKLSNRQFSGFYIFLFRVFMRLCWLQFLCRCAVAIAIAGAVARSLWLL